MFGNSAEAMPTDAHPLIKQRMMAKRSIFAPGHRIRVNVVAIFLNVFIPWGVFILCCGITSFWLMYAHPELAWAIISTVFVLWGASLCLAIGARRFDPDPTWFTFSALIVGIMAISGTVVGLQNFKNYSKPYFEINDLKTINGIDASFTPGKNVMDGGIFHFNAGNQIDDNRSWHFHFHNTYCVAPIITNNTAPLTQTYDFWAVGKDCCSVSASDFRCGSWGSTRSAGGVRVISSGDMGYYKLAVQQTESLYNIMAPNPIFLTWSENPAMEVEAMNQQVFKNYLVMVAFAFIASLFLVTLAACRFAWMGRGQSVYSMKFNNDPTWDQGGIQKPMDYKTHMYTA